MRIGELVCRPPDRRQADSLPAPIAPLILLMLAGQSGAYWTSSEV